MLAGAALAALVAFTSELAWFDGLGFLFYNDTLALTFFVFAEAFIIAAVLRNGQIDLPDYFGAGQAGSLDIFDHGGTCIFAAFTCVGSGCFRSGAGVAVAAGAGAASSLAGLGSGFGSAFGSAFGSGLASATGLGSGFTSAAGFSGCGAGCAGLLPLRRLSARERAEAWARVWLLLQA